MIGDVLLDCAWAGETLAGFENHAGRTILDDGAEPLGRVIARLRQRRRHRLRGLPRRPRLRHLPPRPAAAAKPLVRRPAARRRARAPHGRRGRARAAPRRARGQKLTRVCAAARALPARRARLRRTNPERTEVHRGVARPPALDEALHRRVEDDLLELVEREQPQPADGRVVRLDVLERAVREVDAEDDVDDVAVAGPPGGRDRLGDRDRPFEARGRPARPSSSPSSRRSASSSVSPPSTPPPGSSQYSLPGFSCRQSSTRFCQWISAATRIRASISACDEPKPRTPRSESGSSSTSTQLDLGHRDDDELRDAHPRLDDERLARIGVRAG